MLLFLLYKDLYNGTEVCYTYDNNGNILTKSENGTVKEYKYYEGTDRLASYNGEVCEYDAAGNPKKYRNLSFEWSKGRQLTRQITKEGKTVEYTYDGSGLRRTKTSGGVTKTYDYENGRLVRESGGEKPVRFLYGEGGIIGIKLNKAKFLFRKNAFGDVTEIYNAEGELVAKYNYSAYGKCEIKDSQDDVAKINPIRYRGYYYDEETGLYYLKSRYYDPETGRFLNADDISYLDPETINGLNLYAYCGNNPVMNVDPNGTFFWLAFLAVVGISALIGAIDGGVTAAMSGQNFWLGFAAGAIGGAVGGAIGYFIPGAWGNVVGRIITNFTYGLLNEVFQTGSLENMNWGTFTFDIVADVAFSMLYADWTMGIGSKLSSKFVGNLANVLQRSVTAGMAGFIDTIIDIIETALYNRKRKSIAFNTSAIGAVL